MAKQATLRELQTYYDLADVLDMHELIDISNEMEMSPPQDRGRA